MSDIPEGQSANYAARRRSYADLRDQIETQNRWLKRTTAISLLLAAVAVGSNAWIATSNKVTGYVVEVNKLGESLVTRRLEASLPFDPTRIKPQLARWVFDFRALYPDRRTNMDRYTEVYAWVADSSEAKHAIDDFYYANNPDARSLKETVLPTIEDVFPSGGDTWTVTWFEDVSRKDGMPPARSYWTMDIRIKPAGPAKTDDDLIHNPGRFYVTWFHGRPRVTK